MRLFIPFFLFLGLVLSSTTVALAQTETVRRYASIVVDADTLEIIHARQIDEERFPASLTKVMTLYLAFDALDAGRLTLKQPLKISKKAANTPPVKIGVRSGRTLSVEDAIQALTVRSANDAAVVLAEAIAGSEANFAKMMTERAQSLGMVRTQFRNSNGLPHLEQKTTARDMAKLATAILNNHKRYYHYFGQKSFRYGNRTYKNTNSLLHDMPEVDGFKTGYTNASGYNLIISAQKDERRLIAVVLGGATGTSRNQHMRDLIRRGFKSMGLAEGLAEENSVARIAPVSLAPIPETSPSTRISKKSLPDLKKSEVIEASVPLHAIRLRGRDNQTINIAAGHIDVKLPRPSSVRDWSVQVGVFAEQKGAFDQLTALMGFSGHKLTQDNGVIVPVATPNGVLFRARFGRLTYEEAQAACHSMSNLAKGCFVVASAK